jgi:hypothetical protein
MKLQILVVVAACFFSSAAGVAVAQDTENASGQFGDLIPRFLRGLVHAPEVQTELKLTGEQVASLETLFRKIDARWFPARILPAEQQAVVIHELEQ